MGAIHIGIHDIGLSDMSRKEQADPDVVLNAIRLAGRYSIFDATANPTITRTIMDLESSRLTVDKSGSYPWINVVAIDGEPIARAAAAAE